MVELAVTSLLLAAKLEESIEPNFDKMISLLDENEIKCVSKKSIISLER